MLYFSLAVELHVSLSCMQFSEVAAGCWCQWNSFLVNLCGWSVFSKNKATLNSTGGVPKVHYKNKPNVKQSHSEGPGRSFLMITQKYKSQYLREDKRLREQRKITVQWTCPSDKFLPTRVLSTWFGRGTHLPSLQSVKSCLKSYSYRCINIYKEDAG